MKNSKKGFAPMVVLLVAIVIGAGIFVYASSRSSALSPTKDIQETVPEEVGVQADYDKRRVIYTNEYTLTGSYTATVWLGGDYHAGFYFSVDPSSSVSRLPSYKDNNKEWANSFRINNDDEVAAMMGIDYSTNNKDVALVRKNDICKYEGNATIVLSEYIYLNSNLAGKGGDANQAVVAKVATSTVTKQYSCLEVYPSYFK